MVVLIDTVATLIRRPAHLMKPKHCLTHPTAIAQPYIYIDNVEEHIRIYKIVQEGVASS